MVRFLMLRMAPGKHTAVGSSRCVAVCGGDGSVMLRASECRTLGQRMDPSHRWQICKGQTVGEGQLPLLERYYGRNKGGSEQGGKQVKCREDGLATCERAEIGGRGNCASDLCGSCDAELWSCAGAVGAASRGRQCSCCGFCWPAPNHWALQFFPWLCVEGFIRMVGFHLQGFRCGCLNWDLVLVMFLSCLNNSYCKKSPICSCDRHCFLLGLLLPISFSA